MIEMAIANKAPEIVAKNATAGLMRHLRPLMDAREISPNQLAKELGISRAKVYALYSGTYGSSVSFDDVAAIARRFEVSTDYFLQ